MSSAVNHAKRSHKSHAKHFNAAGLRRIQTQHQQERRGSIFLRPGFFKARRAAPAAKPAKGGKADV